MSTLIKELECEYGMRVWGMEEMAVVIAIFPPHSLPFAWDAARSLHHFFTDSSQILSNGSTAGSTPVPHPSMGLSLPHSLDVIGLVDLPDSLLGHHHPPMSTSPLAGQSGQSWREERAHWSSSRSPLSLSRRLHKS